MSEQFSKKKIFDIVLLLLSVVGLIFSILVYLQHQGNAVVNGVCSAINFMSQCDIVGQSQYSKLVGVDNSIIGIFCFSIMVYLTSYLLFRKSRLYTSLVLVGSVFAGLVAISFILIQMFIINAYCIYCVIVDLASIGLMCVSLIKLKKNHL